MRGRRRSWARLWPPGQQIRAQGPGELAGGGRYGCVFWRGLCTLVDGVGKNWAGAGAGRRS